MIMEPVNALDPTKLLVARANTSNKYALPSTLLSCAPMQEARTVYVTPLKKASSFKNDFANRNNPEHSILIPL
jgi:hypothetical protein